MDDGELDFSNQEIFSNPEVYQNQNLGGDVPGSRSMDSFFDDIFTDSHACTHTHTCNPPGPDFSHTHTCLHVHTKIVPASSEDKADDSAESSERKGSKKRPLGNREAVRKYREKKKARAASLEDEVVRLRALNQQLLKRLQGQAALESEVARLKCLLVDIRGRIEGEIGSFPYQKSSAAPAVVGNNGSYVMNPCNVQCGGQIYCHPEGRNADGSAMNVEPYSGCGFENLPCAVNPNGSGLKECGVGTVPPHTVSSGRNKKKGGGGGASHAATAS